MILTFHVEKLRDTATKSRERTSKKTKDQRSVIATHTRNALTSAAAKLPYHIGYPGKFDRAYVRISAQPKRAQPNLLS
jgi:hypothetical protein